MLSVRESAQQLGVSPSRVRALIKEGRLPAAKNGREWMIREEDVLQRHLGSTRRDRRPRLAQKPLLARTICTTHVGTRLGTSLQLR